MNKKTKKIIMIVLILVLIYFAIPFFRNPLSDFVSRTSVERYLDENYADMGYEIESFGYNGLDINYRYTVAIPGSMDRHFDIYIKKYGKIYLDEYKNFEENGGDVFAANVGRRLNAGYWEIVENALDTDMIMLPSEYGFSSGSIEFATKEAIEKYDYIPDYACPYEDLVPDEVYDLQEMGSRHGKVNVFVNHAEELSYERMAEVLLWVRDELDSAGIGFCCVYASIDTPPSGEYGEAQPSDPYIAVNDFPYAEIYEENLAQRVEANYKAYLDESGDPQT
ncbi:MAG: hypothetical protein E7218_08295, partial [Anaerofustis stercorihominis]|nr:hypothetical protein [Anaerofustis stercorihominis]